MINIQCTIIARNLTLPKIYFIVVCCHCPVLETEIKLIEAAKRNDVEAMKLWGRGVNANVKNVVSVR